MKKLLALTIITFLSFQSYGQEIPVNIASNGIYDFIDELVSLRIIDANTTVKPYSRRQVGEWLLAARSRKDMLNSRQVKEVDFYLRDFYKDVDGYKPAKKRFDLYYHSDSNFSITVNPILGAYAFKNSNKMVYGRYSGAEIFGKVARGWGYYINIRDSYESKMLRSPSYITQTRGAVVKLNKADSSIEFNEINGGISYSWKWGSLSLEKENVVWGSGYNGTNILSGHSPSFAMVKLKVNPVRWMDFTYFHGWLVSNVIDSSTINKNNTRQRWEYYGKYIAANMLTIKPVKWAQVSVGSSVIYSYRTPQLPYFIPIMFFKAVDHWYSNLTDNTDQNSQMFLDINLYPYKGLKLYGTIYIDEIGLSRATDNSKQSNQISVKGGVSLANWPINNTQFIVEYTRTNPYTYNHWADVQTYATNFYNFGNYLRDNSDDFYSQFKIKPLKNVHISLEYLLSRKGPNYRTIKNSAWGKAFMEEVRWQRKAITGNVTYQPINDLYISLSVENSNITGPDVKLYTPSFLQGKTTTVFGSVNFGF